MTLGPPRLGQSSLLRTGKRLAAALIAAVFMGTGAAGAKPTVAEKKSAPLPASPEIAEKQADLGELRSRIEGLRKELSSSEETKADAGDRLRESDRLISRLQRELHELNDSRAQLEKKLRNLEQQSQELSTTLGQQQSQLEKLLYKQYLRGTPDSLQLLLNGDDPNQMARDLHYLSAIALTRAELMGEIAATLDKKKSLAADAKERSAELAEVEAEQKKRHADLQKQREERQALYAQISSKVSAQRKEIGNLQQNEKRMTQLIDRLSKILAAQAAQAAKAAEAARAAEARQALARQKEREKESEKRHPAPQEKEIARPTPSVEPSRPRLSEAENRYEPAPSDGSFARQRGHLRLPVRGAVSGRFGTARDGGGTWRGLFIKAGSGSEVKAIAGGRVVFSEWMRGFGNLLIVDHGDAYLSIYGNNDALLKQVGQAVKGGETVATVGNSGANPESGLYFELRHQGQPIDPMKWASLK
ncbi:murein hydrolase activator EnvC [Dechloromonas sp. HYN0024]|uniref:murein hydrolase activator EnvC family protein n=1 Tax=Dechloromonas sp. HYN0024 TaxID=2231055 RepID=UPI000E447A06|nr:peptidoglycan DD-metalloendopeptidase family protein [Dechloromonas sp. HYN0024]AXS79026.1 peptidase M23 [Dechloromonas sp. HYN0024]